MKQCRLPLYRGKAGLVQLPVQHASRFGSTGRHTLIGPWVIRPGVVCTARAEGMVANLSFIIDHASDNLYVTSCVQPIYNSLSSRETVLNASQNQPCTLPERCASLHLKEDL